MSDEIVTIRSFIDEKFVPDMRKMIASELTYYAFGNMGQMIEIVGKIGSGVGVDANGGGQTREKWFESGVKLIFKTKGSYKTNHGVLRAELRNTMAHQMRPGAKFILTEYKNLANDAHHWTKDGEGRWILVFETFLADFVSGINAIYQSKAYEDALSKSFQAVRTIQVGKVASSEYISASACSTKDFPLYPNLPPLFPPSAEPGIGFSRYEG